jgi:hypothetical protein
MRGHGLLESIYSTAQLHTLRVVAKGISIWPVGIESQIGVPGTDCGGKPCSRPLSRFGATSSLEVLHALLVIRAEVFQQFCVGHELLSLRKNDRSRVRPWIVDRDLDIHAADIQPAKPFDDTQ